jgi:D-sedoheptulose 7-phosphate isomerase
MNKVEELFNQNSNPETFSRAYLDHLTQVISKVDVKEIAQFIEELQAARERNSTIYFIGNGGSAATASHFVNDISIGIKSWDKPYKALCLSDNIPGLTAIANDYGYENIFILPLKTHFKKSDLLVAISASGNSLNIIKAVEYANSLGAMTIGLTGFEGGKLRSISKISVHVPTQTGEFGPVEDVHMILDHLVHAYLMYDNMRKNPL